MDFRYPREGAENDVFEAGLRCGGGGDGVSVAAEASGNPEHLDFRDGLRLASRASTRSHNEGGHPFHAVRNRRELRVHLVLSTRFRQDRVGSYMKRIRR